LPFLAIKGLSGPDGNLFDGAFLVFVD